MLAVLIGKEKILAAMRKSSKAQDMRSVIMELKDLNYRVNHGCHDCAYSKYDPVNRESWFCTKVEPEVIRPFGMSNANVWEAGICDYWGEKDLTLPPQEGENDPKLIHFEEE